MITVERHELSGVQAVALAHMRLLCSPQYRARLDVLQDQLQERLADLGVPNVSALGQAMVDAPVDTGRVQVLASLLSEYRAMLEKATMPIDWDSARFREVGSYFHPITRIAGALSTGELVLDVVDDKQLYTYTFDPAIGEFHLVKPYALGHFCRDTIGVTPEDQLVTVYTDAMFQGSRVLWKYAYDGPDQYDEKGNTPAKTKMWDVGHMKDRGHSTTEYYNPATNEVLQVMGVVARAYSVRKRDARLLPIHIDGLMGIRGVTADGLVIAEHKNGLVYVTEAGGVKHAYEIADNHGTAACMRTDGSVVFACGDGLVHWDPLHDKFKSMHLPQGTNVSQICLCPWNERYAAVASGNAVQIFDLHAGTLEKTVSVPGESVAIGASCDQLYAASDKQLFVMEANAL